MRIPFDLMASMAPILAAVEGCGAARHRESLLWRLGVGGDGAFLERLWLARQFPHLQEDTIDAMVEGSCPDLLMPTAPRNLLTAARGRAMLRAMGHLAGRFLIWRGQHLRIRAGRMEELHEVDSRLPGQHLAAAFLAEAVGRGELDWAAAAGHTQCVSDLWTENIAFLRRMRGRLVDGHVHLRGVTDTSEAWALRVFQPGPARFALRGLPEPASLNVLAGRLAATLFLVAFLRDVNSLGDPPLAGGGDPSLAGELEKGLAVLEDVLTSPIVRGGRLLCVLHRLDRLQLRMETERRGAARGGGAGIWETAGVGLARAMTYGGAMATRMSRPCGPRELARKFHLLAYGALRERGREHRGSGRGQGEGVSSPFATIMFRSLAAYLLNHTLYHQMGSQGRERPGLRRFKTFFHAPQRRLAKGSEEATAILRRVFLDHGVPLLEGRVGPPPQTKIRRTFTAFGALLEEWADGRPMSAERPSPGLDQRWDGQQGLGLVFHFIKYRDGRPFPGNRGARAVGRRRYTLSRQRARRDALELMAMLMEDPAAGAVVGIDAASEELAAPPEVFAPAFRFLRNRRIPAAREDDLYSPVHRVSGAGSLLRRNLNLGATYHVGEDYLHLLSGLRAIYEAIEFLELRSGDRLGHAIALGIGLEDWMNVGGGVRWVSQQEWLDNLVWLWHMLGPGHRGVRRLGLELEISRLASEIYAPIGKSVEPTPNQLFQAWQLRELDPDGFLFEKQQYRRPAGTWSPLTARWWDLQEERAKQLGVSNFGTTAWALHRLYLDSMPVRTAGSTLRETPWSEQWFQLLQEAQSELQALINQRGIAIEVNPSSNIRVASLDGIHQHHFFNLMEQTEHAPSLVITVNTDDPGVFRTSLHHEYVLLAESLCRDRGWPEDRVLKWLDQALNQSKQRTFLPVHRGEGLRELRSLARDLYKSSWRYGITSRYPAPRWPLLPGPTKGRPPWPP